MPLLEITDLHVSYGPIFAVRGLDLAVEEGELVALLGPNGAGKSSTLAALMGMVRPASGSVRFDGRDIGGWSTERIVRRGMTLVPEGRRVFADLTVTENLRLGAATGGADRWSKLFGSMFPILQERRNQRAGTLSGGEQQQLAIARALLSNPRVLLLDEPSLGLAPAVVDRIFDLIKVLHDEGLTVVLVEQNARRALEMSDRAIVLASGECVSAGTPADLLAGEALTHAFFGGEEKPT
jgi:branched-chain amino acid transport system ATP-binding protein